MERLGGNMPANQQQYEDMVRDLRDIGHILENVRGNVCSALDCRQGYQGYRTDDAATHVPQTETQPRAANQSTDGHQQTSGEPACPAATASNCPVCAAASWGNALAGTAGDDAYWGDAGTDTDTESSLGDDREPLPCEDLLHEQEQELLWPYNHAKRNCRRFAGKPVRRLRCSIRKSFRRKGRGRGRRLSGKGAGTSLANQSNEECETFFMRRKG